MGHDENSGGWDRTSDTRLMKPLSSSPNPFQDNSCAKRPQRLDRALTKPVGENDATSPDLARVIDLWPALPEAIRRAILALVESSTG